MTGTPTTCLVCGRASLLIAPSDGRPPWAMHTDLTAPLRCLTPTRRTPV